MAITARIRNFQSIEDVTIVLDGFTVVTGQNNAGKTAVVRAIRGVFTNAAPGPLVRHGCSHLTVDIDFGDGNTVTWEKGPKVNRYVVNGKLLDNFGRGVPPEVEALGVRVIQAGTERVWPQIADQFSGVLFLVGNPGSVMAEAVANVDKVGKLSAALKLSESDKRSVTSTLKVRRSDKETLDKKLLSFDGLDRVGQTIAGLVSQIADLTQMKTKVAELVTLQSRHQKHQTLLDTLVGVTDVVLPSTDGVEPQRQKLASLREIAKQHHIFAGRVKQLWTVSEVQIPLSGQGLQTQQTLADHKQLQKRYRSSLVIVSHLSKIGGVSIPEVSPKLKQVKDISVYAQGVRKRISDTQEMISKLESQCEAVNDQLVSVESEVKSLIAELGVCPTCRRAHGVSCP